MNYELARQLKDAGFPHPFKQTALNPDPTLEELIEACGEKFALHKNSDHWVAWKINSSPQNREAHDFLERAPTPTEAVARLWLALNQKSVSPKERQQIQ